MYVVIEAVHVAATAAHVAAGNRQALLLLLLLSKPGTTNMVGVAVAGFYQYQGAAA